MFTHNVHHMCYCVLLTCTLPVLTPSHGSTLSRIQQYMDSLNKQLFLSKKKLRMACQINCCNVCGCKCTLSQARLHAAWALLSVLVQAVQQHFPPALYRAWVPRRGAAAAPRVQPPPEADHKPVHSEAAHQRVGSGSVSINHALLMHNGHMAGRNSRSTTVAQTWNWPTFIY